MDMGDNGNIISMVIGAGVVVRLVLLCLVIFSLACWAVIFAKLASFRRARRLNKDFLNRFWGSSSLGALRREVSGFSGAPMAGVFLQGHDELRRLKECAAGASMQVWLETLERSLEKGIREEMARLERMVPFLATTGNSAPFIGLFGTVWGIMSSFHKIGLQGSASLATVAPGISEALVATAAGLAAAIPGVMAFNALTTSLGRMEDELKGFATDFLNTVERRLAVNPSGRGDS